MESASTFAPVEPSQREPAESPVVLKSVLLCSFRPATAARATLDVPLRRAYWVHALSALGMVLAILVVIAWVESGSDPPLDVLAIRSLATLAELLDAFADHPLPMTLSVVGIELGYAALAFLFIAWGARDEPLLGSALHALRRVWMQTPQLFLFTVLVGVTVAQLDRVRQGWESEHPVEYPQRPAPPPGVQQGTPQWDQYLKEIEAYYDRTGQIRQQRRALQPWHVRHAEAIQGVSSFLLGLGFVLSILRAVGVPRATPPVERPPRCEACGYDLTLMPIESRCPECGEVILASLGPDVRPGPPWLDRRLGAFARLGRTWARAVFSPTAFGRTLRVIEPGTEHRSFLFWHLPIVFLIGACTPPALSYVIDGKNPMQSNPEILLFVAPLVGTMCVIGAMGMTLKFAAWAGWYHWWREKRNLLPAAIQVTCYLTPVLIAWELFGGTTGILSIKLANSDGYRTWARAGRMDPDAILVFAWMALNVLCLVVYGQLVKRIVAAARFANK